MISVGKETFQITKDNQHENVILMVFFIYLVSAVNYYLYCNINYDHMNILFLDFDKTSASNFESWLCRTNFRFGASIICNLKL